MMDERETHDTGTLLRVEDLSVQYLGASRAALEGVSVALHPGERLGIVGESGSGKTTLALAITDLLPRGARITTGRVMIAGKELASLSRKEARQMRGGVVGRVPQDALGGLNPVITIGHQLRDAILAHRKADRQTLTAEMVDALRDVGIPDVEQKLRAYPHELSGGMRQRVLIAMAMINGPQLIVADEPTTALDTTVQTQVLATLERAAAARSMALILISHDLNVVASLCGTVIVMYAGEVVERGPLDRVLASPAHPYTKALIEVGHGARREERTNATIDRQQPAPTGGCRYHSRCPIAIDACARHPRIEPLGEDTSHAVRCIVAQREAKADEQQGALR